MAYLHIGNKALEKISLQEKYIRCNVLNVWSLEKEEWGIHSKEAFSCLKKEEEKETPLLVVFWKERKSQTIENKELNRKGTCSVMEICGNSSLLFPNEFPLDKWDMEGCLIGEDTAWQLFGGKDVVGKSLVYGKKTYYIRGVLPKEDIFVCEASQNSTILFNKLTFYGDSYLEKEKIKEQLGNEYGLSLNEDPLYWHFIFIRTALFLFPAGFIVVVLILSRKKKRLFGAMVFLTFAFLIGGMVFIFDITPDKLPNRLSDLEFWSKLFEQYKKDFFLFCNLFSFPGI